MDYSFTLLTLCNLMLPLAVIAQRYIKEDGVKIDHVFLFSVGFIFYFILPFYLGMIGFISKYENSGDIWYEIFLSIERRQLIIYMLSCLMFYLSFIGGDVVYKGFYNRLPPKWLTVSIPLSNRLLKAVFVFALLLTSFYLYPLRHKFFSGYKISPMFVETGPLTAMVISLLSLAFIYSSSIYQECGKKLMFSKCMVNSYFIMYLFCVILLVSIGGRLVFISSILMVLVFYSVYFRPVQFSTLIGSLFAVIMISHLIVYLRVQHIKDMTFYKFSIEAVLMYLYSETVNVSFSLLGFLKNYKIDLLKMPVIIASRLINVIPSSLMPHKGSFVVQYGDLGYNIYAPHGGLNAFVSLVVNFGSIGAMAVLFLFSFFMSWFKELPNTLTRAAYILISGWLAISFFRNFEGTLVKMIIEFSILLPIFLSVVTIIVRKAGRR